MNFIVVLVGGEIFWRDPPLCTFSSLTFCLNVSSCLKPHTHVALNLLAIGLRLDARIACDDLKQKFQHADYFNCDPCITQPNVIGFSNGYS